MHTDVYMKMPKKSSPSLFHDYVSFVIVVFYSDRRGVRGHFIPQYKYLLPKL